MKTILYSLIFLLSFSWPLIAQQNQLLEAKGLIAGKHPVNMIIRINAAGEIYGFYEYDKYQQKIVLYGQQQEDSVILYEEMDGSFSFDKGFKGILKNGEINGQWLDVYGKKKFDFNLNIVKDDSAEATSAWEGRYESIHNSDQYFASLFLQHIKEKVFFFEISTGTDTGCVGFLQGLLMIEDSTADFNGNGCNLNFSFQGNQLTIDEGECGFHGERCSFNGEYNR